MPQSESPSSGGTSDESLVPDGVRNELASILGELITMGIEHVPAVNLKRILARLAALERSEAPPPIEPIPDEPPPPPPPPSGVTRTLKVSTSPAHTTPQDLDGMTFTEGDPVYIWLADPDPSGVSQVEFKLDGASVETLLSPSAANEWWYGGTTPTGEIQHDNKSKLVSTGAQTTVSWSHTVTGTDRVLLVFLGGNGDLTSGGTQGGVTYQGQALTFSHRSNSGGFRYIELWYLLNPPTGTGTIAVSYGANTPSEHIHFASSYTGVSGLGATSTANGSSATPNIALTTTQNASWIVGGFHQGNTSLGPYTYTPDAGTVERDEGETRVGSGGRGGAYGDRPKATPGSVSVGWTRVPGNSTGWDAVAVELLRAAGAGGAHASVVLPPTATTFEAVVSFTVGNPETSTAVIAVETDEPAPLPPQPQGPNPPTPDVTFNSGNPYTPTKVNNEPAGTVFLFTTTGGDGGGAIYESASIPTKNGNTYIAESGVVLDGNLNTNLAFASDGVNVRIFDFEFKAYLGVDSTGGANQKGAGAILMRDGWQVYRVHGHDNKFAALRFKGSNILVQGGRLNHNSQYGFCGTGRNSVIRDVEVDNNGSEALLNQAESDSVSGDKGGCKMVHSDGFSFINLHVHDNYSQGLWTDINNTRILYDGCYIHDNNGAGIQHEISCSAEIRNCRIINHWRLKNTTNPLNPPAKAGIQNALSPNVWIHDNYVEGAFYGITAWNWSHSRWYKGGMSNCCLGVQNLLVENNTVVMRDGTGVHAGKKWVAAFALTGKLPADSFRTIDQRCGQPEINTAAANNRFRKNKVTLTGGRTPSTPYLYMAQLVTPTQWASLGYS